MTILGLTGGIGMGKSTTASMFAARGIPVWDADAAVHRLYGSGGAAVGRVAAAFPACLRDGVIDRDVLRAIVAPDPDARRRLEAIVHPLVAEDRADFLEAVSAAPLVVLDLPLLYEFGLDAVVDKVAVVSVDQATQRARVLGRGAMTEKQFEALRAAQVPDADKRARADYIVDTTSIETATAAVDRMIEELGGAG